MMGERRIDFPIGTPGSYVRLVARARKRLLSPTDAGTGGRNTELADVVTKMATHALECCRVGLTQVRPVVTIDSAVIGSLEALMLEVGDELLAGPDPRDVDFTQSMLSVLAQEQSSNQTFSRKDFRPVPNGRVSGFAATKQLALGG